MKFLEQDNLESKILNIGTGHQTKIIDLARKILLLTNSKSTIRFLESKKDYITRRCANINLLNQLFERPKLFSLDEGLMETIRWYRIYNERFNNSSRI